MVEVIVENRAYEFQNKVSDLLSKGYKLYGAGVAKNEFDNSYPFVYTAILIKL